MYTVTPATARPQGFSGAQLRLPGGAVGTGPAVSVPGRTEHELRACRLRHRARHRRESSILRQQLPFAHPATQGSSLRCSQDVSKAVQEKTPTKSFPKGRSP